MNAKMPVQRFGFKKTKETIMTILAAIVHNNPFKRPTYMSLEVYILRSINSYMNKHEIILVNTSEETESKSG